MKRVDPIHAVIILKTSHGGSWILPHVDELLARGHRVSAILPRGPGQLRERLASRDVSVVDSPFSFSFRRPLEVLRGLTALRRVVEGMKPDVLMYHLYASALAVRFSTCGLGVPRVHMVAGPLYLDSRPIRTAERLLGWLDTQIIAGSQHTADRYSQLGLSRRVISIPYGVDMARFSPQAARHASATRRDLGIPVDAFLAIMVAYVYAPKRLVHPGIGIKGHDVILQAWKEVRRAAPSANLLLVGAGFDRQGELHRQKLIRGGHLAKEGITWLDTVDDVRPYYGAADVSVSPSLSENHGAALEASACGVPSIVSDAGALPETVTPDSGWIVPAGQAQPLAEAVIAAIGKFENGDLESMGQHARMHVEAHFASRPNAERVVDVLERFCGARGGRPTGGTS